MTVEQVAAYLQVHRMTVYRHIRAGRLPAVRVGRVYRIRRDDLEEFLSLHRTRPHRAAPAGPAASVPPPRPDPPARPGSQPVPPAGRDRALFSLHPLEWVLHSLH